MDSTDFVLSDVHVYTSAIDGNPNSDMETKSTLVKQNEGNNNKITRFFFQVKTNCDGQYKWQSSAEKDEIDVGVEKESCQETDEDGDIVITLRKTKNPFDMTSIAMRNNVLSSCESERIKETPEVIYIEHKPQTILKEVGYQVWLGSLLLCDYLIDCGESLRHHSVLDMGAGTGLTSIIAAMYAKMVICTDFCQNIVNLAEKNWKRNSELLPTLSPGVDIAFQVLDWTKHCLDSDSGEYNTDVQKLTEATLILAAEVVYDDDLTDAFFQTIYYLLRNPPERTVIMSVEKRIVFDSAWRDVCSPYYEHFQENLKDLCSVDDGKVQFKYEQISAGDLPQYFLYNRTPQLELWKISSYFPKCENGNPMD